MVGTMKTLCEQKAHSFNLAYDSRITGHRQYTGKRVVQ